MRTAHTCRRHEACVFIQETKEHLQAEPQPDSPNSPEGPSKTRRAIFRRRLSYVPVAVFSAVLGAGIERLVTR